MLLIIPFFTSDIEVLTNKTIRIARTELSSAVVKGRFLKIHQFHIEYVLECLKRNTVKITNIKSYLLTALYNAPSTMDSYYQNMVNHDLYGTE